MASTSVCGGVPSAKSARSSSEPAAPKLEHQRRKVADQLVVADALEDERRRAGSKLPGIRL